MCRFVTAKPWQTGHVNHGQVVLPNLLLVSFEIVGWWFATFFIFPYIGNNNPNWLIFFGGVETTNQKLLLGNPMFIFSWVKSLKSQFYVKSSLWLMWLDVVGWILLFVIQQIQQPHFLWTVATMAPQEIPVSGAPGKGPQHEGGHGCLNGVRNGKDIQWYTEHLWSNLPKHCQVSCNG